MRHGLQAENMPSGGLLQVFLLLGLIFACESDVQCPQELANGIATVVYSDGLNVRSIATFQCPSGQYPWPQSSRTCQANGKWTDIKSSSGKRIREISCRSVKCPEPNKFENGEFYPRGPFYIDANITFVCNDGYIPRGSMVRTCKKNGKWSGETAICDDGAGHCPDPGLPPGAVKTGLRYDMDESVSYRCVTGLTLIGSSKRTCLESRRWSGTEVSCQYPYTFDLPEEAGAKFAGSLSGILETSEKKSGLVGRTFKIKKDGILNVYILLDASQSVGKDNFTDFKTCAETLVNKLGDFDMTIHFGVLSFATEPIVTVDISNMDQAEDVVDLIRSDMKYNNHKDKSGTNTFAALKKVHEMMSLQEKVYNPVQWSSVHHVIVLLTDGKANMGGRPAHMIKNIRNFLNITNKREDYLDIYAFGIGDGTDKTELNEIASQKENEQHVFVLKSTEHMKNTFHQIIAINNFGEMCGLNNENEGADDTFSHPWNVRIATQAASPCFGSLISSSWVLSAAHCFKVESNTDIHTLYIGDKEYKAENILIHDCYNLRRKVDRGITQDYDYDVALIKLTEKVKFSISTRPICLPCTEPANRAMKKKPSTSCDEHRNFLLESNDVPAGFLARTKEKNEVEEMNVNIKHMNLREACVSAVKKKNITLYDMVSPRHLCVEGQMSCKGESGGSLFVNIRERARFFQVGILSFGTYNPCLTARRVTEKFPRHARDFYINVMDVLPWLHKHLKEEIQFQPGIKSYEEVVCPK